MKIEEICERLTQALPHSSSQKPLLIAIDGRCGAGKTTLAEVLAKHRDAATVHVDDFFLRPEQRTPQRLSEPGGNFDRERLLAEVLLPLANGGESLYRPYCCKTATVGEAIPFPKKTIVIVEGSYACHPLLFPYYGMSVFLTVDEKTQRKRLEERNPALLPAFLEKWIPMEEKYFRTLQIPQTCTFVFSTDGEF